MQKGQGLSPTKFNYHYFHLPCCQGLKYTDCTSCKEVKPHPNVLDGVLPRGVMVKAMNCGIVVREFVLQSRYYVHFRANTLGKGMNPLILPPAMGK